VEDAIVALANACLCCACCTCTGNHIYATIHSKHTECRAVMDSIRRSTDRAMQPVEASMLDQCSDETIKRKLNDYDLSEKEKLNIVQLLDAKVLLRQQRSCMQDACS
jgi:hypothetical protein